jgi:cytochrome c oxidase subunit 2
MLNRFHTKKFCNFFVFIFSLLIGQPAMARANYWQMNMHQGVTPLSHDMYYLHMVGMYVCAGIGVIVFGVMIYSLIYHRKSQGATPATFHDNFRLEIVWSVIPFLILVALAVPATKILIRMNDTHNSDITIKITGSQWKWQYQYLDQGISYFSNISTPYAQIHNKEKKGQWYLLEVDKPLVLPINQKIRFLVTSTDVVHSWWVPQLGIKRDAIPGFMYEAWAIIKKPGVYRGQCTELCGVNHGFMPIVVRALAPDDFAKWVAAEPKVPDIYAPKDMKSEEHDQLPYATLMSEGRKNYEKMCLACHKSNGTGEPPLYPALKASSISVGKPISRHINLILHGIPNSAMQSYKDQLTDREIAAIVTYERNAWGNNTGDVVQPSDVHALREGEQYKVKMVDKAQVGGFK